MLGACILLVVVIVLVLLLLLLLLVVVVVVVVYYYYFSFQSVLHDWCNKGCGMSYPVCGMMHTK